jgi:hypothetical protein
MILAPAAPTPPISLIEERNYNFISETRVALIRRGHHSRRRTCLINGSARVNIVK